MTALLIASSVLAVVWVLPAISDGLGVVKLVVGPKRDADDSFRGSQRFLILVPAHDEASLISRCAGALTALRADRSSCRIVVVADNCSDSTAAIARDAGVEVLERTAPDAPGKPRAIQWALDRLPVDTFDAMVIIDADTEVHPDFADRLAAAGPLEGRACQTYNGILNDTGSWQNELADLLVSVRYEGQYPFKRRAGLNCPLTGNGMCIGTGVLSEHGWSSDSLTENWDMYAHYTARGVDIRLAAGAFVGSLEPAAVHGSSTRRRRWQAGKWQVLRRRLVPILSSPHVGLHQKIDVLAELSSPGPVAHAAVGLSAAAALALLPGPAASVLAALFVASVVPMLAWTLRGWLRHPNRGRLALHFTRLPAYALWRLAVIAGAVPTAIRGAWLRTPRD